MLNKSFASINLLNNALDGSWLKNSAISNNLANVDTPDYKREDVDFKTYLQSEIDKSNNSSILEKTDDGHMDINSASSYGIEKEKNTSYRMDGNNVDIDEENAEMAANTLYYNSIISDLNSQITRLKSVMQVGG